MSPSELWNECVKWTSFPRIPCAFLFEVLESTEVLKQYSCFQRQVRNMTNTVKVWHCFLSVCTAAVQTTNIQDGLSEEEVAIPQCTYGQPLRNNILAVWVFIKAPFAFWSCYCGEDHSIMTLFKTGVTIHMYSFIQYYEFCNLLNMCIK